MKTIYLIIFFVIIGCSDNGKVDSVQRANEKNKTKAAHDSYVLAVEHTKKNDPTGFLKLYEIARNDSKYTVEISEVAHEELIRLLYFKTDLWIKTFAKVGKQEFKAYIEQSGIELSQLPEGVISDKQFKETILKNLKKTKGDKLEKELVVLISAIIQP